MIIDAHLHLNRKPEEKDFTAALIRLNRELDKNQIDKAVIIADNIIGGACIDSWELFKYPQLRERFYFVASPDIVRIRATDWNFFDQHLSNKDFTGLKLFPGHQPYYPTDQICIPVYELASKHHVPVIMHTGANTGDLTCTKYNDPKHIVTIAKKYPQVNFVIAHYFWPQLDYCFAQTSQIQNIFYDTSALADPEVLEQSGGEEKIIAILQKTLQVKPNSVIFGSDYDMCSQVNHLDLARKLNNNDVLTNNFLNCFRLN